jgi:hypothetical protein
MSKIILYAKPYIDNEDGSVRAGLYVRGEDKRYRGAEIEIEDGLEFKDGRGFRDMFKSIKVGKKSLDGVDS